MFPQQDRLLILSLQHYQCLLPIPFTQIHLNLVLGLFNLVPAYPMDGGRIFRSFLATLGTTSESYQRATNVAHWTSFAVATAFLGGGLIHGEFFLAIIGAFIIYVVYKERQGVVF